MATVKSTFVRALATTTTILDTASTVVESVGELATTAHLYAEDLRISTANDLVLNREIKNAELVANAIERNYEIAARHETLRAKDATTYDALHAKYQAMLTR